VGVAEAGDTVTLTAADTRPGFEFAGWEGRFTPVAAAEAELFGTTTPAAFYVADLDFFGTTTPSALGVDMVDLFSQTLAITNANQTTATFVMPDGAVTITALWNPVASFEITLNAGGGTFRENNSATMPHLVNVGAEDNMGAVAGLPMMPAMDNAGNRFIGWYSGTGRVNVGDSVAAGTTLTAHWRAAPSPFRIGAIRDMEVGDANLRVTSADATRLAQFLLENGTYDLTPASLPYRLAADINGDGRITLADLIMLMQMLIGRDTGISR
jgi:hypothetical protein